MRDYGTQWVLKCDKGQQTELIDIYTPLVIKCNNVQIKNPK